MVRDNSTASAHRFSVNSSHTSLRLSFIALCLIGAIGCARLSGSRSAELPDRRKVTRDSLVFHTNFYFPRRHRLIEELLAKRSNIKSILGLTPSDETIHIFLFQDQQKFRRFLTEQHPSFPDRRAFFLRSSTNLMVYAHWNARVAEDLRHEVTHAYLHSVVPEVPLWLDEGIAEYFEVPTSERGLNRDHLDYLVAENESGRWQPDLERLESLRQAGEMSQLDYAESWLWIHFLVHRNEKTLGLLQSYLQQTQYDRVNNNLKMWPQLEKFDADAPSNLIGYMKSLSTSTKLASIKTSQ